MFDRITSSVLLALAHSFRFIESWTPEEQEQFRNKLLDVLDLNVTVQEPEEIKEEATEAETKEEEDSKQMIDTTAADKGKKRSRGRRGLAADNSAIKKRARAAEQKKNYMWAFLSGSYRGRVRAACLSFVAVFINKMPADVIRGQLS